MEGSTPPTAPRAQPSRAEAGTPGGAVRQHDPYKPLDPPAGFGVTSSFSSQPAALHTPVRPPSRTTPLFHQPSNLAGGGPNGGSDATPRASIMAHPSAGAADIFLSPQALTLGLAASRAGIVSSPMMVSPHWSFGGGASHHPAASSVPGAMLNVVVGGVRTVYPLASSGGVVAPPASSQHSSKQPSPSASTSCRPTSAVPLSLRPTTPVHLGFPANVCTPPTALNVAGAVVSSQHNDWRANTAVARSVCLTPQQGSICVGVARTGGLPQASRPRGDALSFGQTTPLPPSVTIHRPLTASEPPLTVCAAGRPTSHSASPQPTVASTAPKTSSAAPATQRSSTAEESPSIHRRLFSQPSQSAARADPALDSRSPAGLSTSLCGPLPAAAERAGATTGNMSQSVSPHDSSDAPQNVDVATAAPAVAAAAGAEAGKTRRGAKASTASRPRKQQPLAGPQISPQDVQRMSTDPSHAHRLCHQFYFTPHDCPSCVAATSHEGAGEDAAASSLPPIHKGAAVVTMGEEENPAESAAGTVPGTTTMPPSSLDQVISRYKQLKIAKNTSPYRRYRSLVPRGERQLGNPNHPITPRALHAFSRRQFKAGVNRSWRHAVHYWEGRSPQELREQSFLPGYKSLTELGLEPPPPTDRTPAVFLTEQETAVLLAAEERTVLHEIAVTFDCTVADVVAKITFEGQEEVDDDEDDVTTGMRGDCAAVDGAGDDDEVGRCTLQRRSRRSATRQGDTSQQLKRGGAPPSSGPEGRCGSAEPDGRLTALSRADLPLPSWRDQSTATDDLDDDRGRALSPPHDSSSASQHARSAAALMRATIVASPAGRLCDSGSAFPGHRTPIAEPLSLVVDGRAFVGLMEHASAIAPVALQRSHGADAAPMVAGSSARHSGAGVVLRPTPAKAGAHSSQLSTQGNSPVQSTPSVSASSASLDTSPEKPPVTARQD
mgnify:CR=1 FL=1